MDLSLSEEEKKYWEEVEYHLEKIYDTLEIYMYGKKIMYREYQKRYYDATSNWMINIVPNYLTKYGITIEEFKQKVDVENFVEMIHISEFYSDVIPFSTCKEIFATVFENNQYPWEIIVELGILDKNDLDVKSIIIESIQRNPTQHEKYKKGNLNMKNFFIGDIMKNYKNKVNLNEVNEQLENLLNTI